MHHTITNDRLDDMHLKIRFPKVHINRPWIKKPSRFEGFRFIIRQKRALRVTKNNLMYIKIKFDMPEAYRPRVILYKFFAKRKKHAACLRLTMEASGRWVNVYIPKLPPQHRGTERTINSFMTRDERYQLYIKKIIREQKEFMKRKIISPSEDQEDE